MQVDIFTYQIGKREKSDYPDLNRRHGTRAGLEAGQLNTIFGSECPKSLDLSKAQGS